MSTENGKIDLGQFSLKPFEKLVVELPATPEVVEEDIDAQLFEYVASAWKGQGMNKLADIDDAWVKDKFPHLSGVAELRKTIREDLEARAKESVQDFKVKKCSDALVEMLEGELAEEIVDDNLEAVRREYLQQLANSGTTFNQYLMRENMTKEQFEDKLRKDVAFRIKLNIALDLKVAADDVYVEDEQLTDYLMAEDSAAFLAEVKDRGMLEAARQAASRIKVMRALVEDAEEVFTA